MPAPIVVVQLIGNKMVLYFGKGHVFSTGKLHLTSYCTCGFPSVISTKNQDLYCLPANMHFQTVTEFEMSMSCYYNFTERNCGFGKHRLDSLPTKHSAICFLRPEA